MSIFTTTPIAGKPRCARCHRPFTLKSADQKFGPTCARKIAAAGDLDAAEEEEKFVRAMEKEKSAPIYVKSATGEVTAVIV